MRRVALEILSIKKIIRDSYGGLYKGREPANKVGQTRSTGRLIAVRWAAGEAAAHNEIYQIISARIIGSDKPLSILFFGIFGFFAGEGVGVDGVDDGGYAEGDAADYG